MESNHKATTIVSCILVTSFFLLVVSSLRAQTQNAKKYVAQRVTQIPEPSPYFKVNIKNTAGTAINFVGGSICSGSWGGQVVAGDVATNLCQTSPASGFTIGPDNSRGFAEYTGIHIVPPTGWSIKTATSNLGGMVSVAVLKGVNQRVGPAYGWQTTALGNSLITIDLTMQTPITPTVTKAPTVVPSKTPTKPPIAATATKVPSAVPTKVPTACPANCALNPRGDADCNLVVNAVDFTIWKNKFITPTLTPQYNTDFNKDGKTDLIDLQILIDSLHKPPTPPAGACGATAVPVKTATPSPRPLTPTLGPGCSYQQVQCIQAPCNPIVVCPTPASGSTLQFEIPDTRE